MWISKAAKAMLDTRDQLMLDQEHQLRENQGENTRLRIENTRLRADLDWFKHRLTQVERERGQLIQAAIGVKIAVPEFVPTYNDPGAALNEPFAPFIDPDAEKDANGVAEPDYSIFPRQKA